MDVSNPRRSQVHMAVPRQVGKGALARELAELLPQDDRLLENLGRRTATLSSWLDQEMGRRLDGDALLMARVSKIANECGEALNALEKAIGLNPRKGVCGTLDDVKDELLDVALTALAAYEHLSHNRGESSYALLSHVSSRMRRVGLEDG